MTTRTIVGIDLGTTYSLVAILQAGRPIVLPNALGEHLTPSAVSVGAGGELLVGAPARARATTHPQQTAMGFKRDMGTSRPIPLGGRTMTAPELSALVLQSLRQDAEAALGRPVDEAVITVPAYFGDLQRKATRDAAAIAGLHVERIVNEPTAAALAYGLHARGAPRRAAVLDLGGGTFDVTVLEIVDGVLEIQASAGDARLGGDDFDQLLAESVAARAGRRLNVDVRADPRTWARVIDASERAKRHLSTERSARVALLGADAGGRAIDFEEVFSREDAEATWQPLLDRMRAPILRALADARARPQEIDEILLVGGATRMPCVADLAAQIFGRLPDRSLPPDEAVALGAAVQAALKANDAAVEDLVVTDVAPFTMGVDVVSSLGNAQMPGLFAPILERGTVIPASRVKTFYTSAPMQRHIRLQVYQGEHSLCRDNQLLGAVHVEGIPLSHEQQPVDVRFTYDMNGLLEVEARVHGTGAVTSAVIERVPGRLSPEEVSRARSAMARLKLHPRDALPNTTALARAEALYVELSGPDRAILGEALNALRLALESQEPALVTALRERLVAVVAALRASARA